MVGILTVTNPESAAVDSEMQIRLRKKNAKEVCVQGNWNVEPDRNEKLAEE
jgi:hypothetical protein